MATLWKLMGQEGHHRGEGGHAEGGGEEEEDRAEKVINKHEKQTAAAEVVVEEEAKMAEAGTEMKPDDDAKISLMDTDSSIDRTGGGKEGQQLNQLLNLAKQDKQGPSFEVMFDRSLNIVEKLVDGSETAIQEERQVSARCGR